VNIYALAKIYVSVKGKPDYPIKVIGKRPGEVLKEKLMSDEELKSAEVYEGKFWIINGQRT